MTLSAQLTVKRRHPLWMHAYPSPSFWHSGHMSLLGHGTVPPVQFDPAFMVDLYRTDRQNTPAASHLRDFERRTVLGRLPASSFLSVGLLAHFQGELTRFGPRLWNDLPDHYLKHGRGEEQPTLERAALRLYRYAQEQGVGGGLLETFFPRRVETVLEYGKLGLALLFAALFESPSPVGFFLYCPNPPETHSLSLNLELSLGFLADGGPLGDRTVRLGIVLADAELFSPPGVEGIFLPRLLPRFRIATLFAPIPSIQTRTLHPGHSCQLYLC